MWPKTERNLSLRWGDYIGALGLGLSGVMLIGWPVNSWGWYIWALGLMSLLGGTYRFGRSLMLLYVSVAILGLASISASLEWSHIFLMGILLSVVVSLPYAVSSMIYKDYLFDWRLLWLPMWSWRRVVYIGLVMLLTTLLLPGYFRATTAYLNWPVTWEWASVVSLGVGIAVLGVWDELFFVITVLRFLQLFLPFPLANALQALLYMSFLYALGFRGWGYVLIFLFAYSQGWVWRRTESLGFLIAVHWAVDVVLFLALLDAHFPGILAI